MATLAFLDAPTSPREGVDLVPFPPRVDAASKEGRVGVEGALCGSDLAATSC